MLGIKDSDKPVSPAPNSPDIDVRWGYVVLCLLLLPTLILVFKHREVWYYDEAYYGLFSVSLFQNLMHSPMSWPTAMFHCLGGWQPALSWLGQFFVPLGYRLPLFQSALLLFVWITEAAAVALLFLALRRIFHNTLVALLASAAVATGPLFTGLAAYFLVEPLQLFAVVWLFALMAYRERMSGLVLGLQVTAAVTFGLLAKVSTPVFDFPCLFFVFLFLITEEARPWRDQPE